MSPYATGHAHCVICKCTSFLNSEYNFRFYWRVSIHALIWNNNLTQCFTRRQTCNGEYTKHCTRSRHQLKMAAPAEVSEKRSNFRVRQFKEKRLFLALLALRAYISARNYFLSPWRAYISACVTASILSPPLFTFVSFSCVVGSRRIPLYVATAASVRFATKV